MRALLVPVVAVVATGSFVVLGSGPAYACSCVTNSPRDFVGSADLVVEGTVQDVAASSGWSSADDVTYEVAAEAVYKGEVTERFAFVSPASGASCGVEGVEADRRYLFLLTRVDDGWHGSLCGGTGQVTAAQAERFAGPPAAPLPGVEPGPADRGVAGLAGVIGAVGVVTALAVLLGRWVSSWRLGRSTDSGHAGT